MDKNSPQRAMLTVSELTGRARTLLEYELANLWVVGEIAGISRPASGHWYFTLKDDRAQLRCVMFRSQNLQTRAPAQGDDVLVCGRVSLYEARGDFQMIVSVMEHRGAGALHRQFEVLKEKLQAEGLFAAERKAPLPSYPARLGLITSASGAALQDMLSVWKRHRSPVELLLYPCSVQGDKAPQELRHALQLANRQGLADVLILGRGGGSYEDLFCFNDEALAREICHSEIPVISAVGHEVDFTIADFVADLRAPTPTAAMELVLRRLSELTAKLQSEERHLSSALQAQLQQRAERLFSLRRRLRNPELQLNQYLQRFDQVDQQLTRTMQQFLKSCLRDQRELERRLQLASPARRVGLLLQRFEALGGTLRLRIQGRVQAAQTRLAHQVSMLESVSPLATVRRGYAIVFDSREQVVRSIDQVDRGDQVSAKLQDGRLLLEVKDRRKGDQG